MTYRRKVLKINGTDYHLVLLDTNALSEFSKHPQESARVCHLVIGV